MTERNNSLMELFTEREALFQREIFEPNNALNKAMNMAESVDNSIAQTGEKW